MSSRIFREERLQLIYEQIRENGKVYVSNLAQEFGVSASSIRLDLGKLEARGLITRTYGGAMLPVEVNGDVIEDISELSLRAERRRAEKEAIGKLTATFIEDGDTIMIDGGSTTKSVAKHLTDKRNLTVITNSISLLPDLLGIKDAVVYLVGGLVYRENAVLVGDIANEIVEYFHPLKVVLGIDGISVSSGLTAADTSVPAVASIKRKMIDVSDQLIVVADHTKLGRVCLMPVAPLKRVDCLVTDSGASAEMVEAIRANGPTVEIAEVET